MNDTDESWQKYGETEPYFGVIADPKFEKERLTPQSKIDFFAGGEDHIANIFHTLQDKLSGFTPRRALDFGCGVGRLLIPLARRCEEVTGVDIAGGMLREADLNCRERQITNVSLVLTNDMLDGVLGKFNLIHSFIVFQHIPIHRGMAILAALIERLDVDGIAVLHLTYRREVSSFKNLVDWGRKHSVLVHYAANAAKGHPFDRPLMQMNTYDLNGVFALFQRKNCRILHADLLDNNGYWGSIFYIQRQ